MSDLKNKRKTTSNGTKKIVVFYHKKCSDGFGAAWAAWRVFGNRAEYRGAEYDNSFLLAKNIKGKEVYFLDFTYPPEMMAKIVKKAAKTVVIDHHVTAKESVEMADDYLYDVNHSGAVLAWKYFHPQKPAPKLLRYIEDMDIWKWRLPSSSQIAAYIATRDLNFQSWNSLAVEMEKTEKRKKIVKQGETLIKYRDLLVQRAIDRAEIVRFEGRDVLAVNYSDRELVSYIGNELAKKHPPFAIIWFAREGNLFVSLRSVKNFDVAKISKKYGGGGHRAAAGFCLPAKIFFPWSRKK